MGQRGGPGGARDGVHEPPLLRPQAPTPVRSGRGSRPGGRSPDQSDSAGARLPALRRLDAFVIAGPAWVLAVATGRLTTHLDDQQLRLHKPLCVSSLPSTVARLEEVMDPAYLDGLETWSLSEVRARQGIGDRSRDRPVLPAEDHSRTTGHRRGRAASPRPAGEESGDLSHLVEQLPKILSGHVRAPGIGRLPAMIGLGEVDTGIELELEAILPASQLGSLPDLSDAYGEWPGF